MAVSLRPVAPPPPAGPALALDFLCEGFRECVREVWRYLDQVEEVEAAAPWWSRLLCHLTFCVSALALPRPLQHPAAPPLLTHQWLRPLPAAYGLSALSEAGGGVVFHSMAPPPSPLFHLAPPPSAVIPPTSSLTSPSSSSSSAACQLWANEVGAF